MRHKIHAKNRPAPPPVSARVFGSEAEGEKSAELQYTLFERC